MRGRALPDHSHAGVPRVQGRAGRLVRLSPAPAAAGPGQAQPGPGRGAVRRHQAAFTVLDRLRSKRRLRIGRTFHLTEFGYQTSPPDPAAGIALTLQTRYLQQAAYIAWKYKRVQRALLLPVGRRADRQPRQRHQALLRLADRAALQQRHAEAGALHDARAVHHRPAAGAHVRGDVGPGPAGRQARGRGADPSARRGRLPQPDDGATRAADGIWTFRTSVTTGAQYRYRWTPQPSIFDPNPLPRESGIIDLGRRESSPYKASLAQ